MVHKERAVKQIHADDAERFLLQCVLRVEHSYMDENLTVLIPGVCLELDTHPAVCIH